MEKQKASRPPVWPVVGRVVAMAGGLRAWLAAALLVDLLLAAVLLLSNHFMRKFFDAVSANQVDQFWVYVRITLAIEVVGIPLSYARKLGMGRFAEGTLARFRAAIALHSARLPMAYLEERHSGDLLSVLNADLGKLKALLQNYLLDLPSQTVRGLAAFAYIVSIHWSLALVSVVVTPLLFLVVSALSRPVAKRSEEMQTEIGVLNSVAQDGIAGAMLVKSFNLSGIIEGKFQAANQQVLQKGLHIARLRAMSDSFGMGLSITPFIIAIGVGGYLVVQKQMTFGALFAFINLLNYVVNPLGSLPNLIGGISEAAGAGRRVFDLLDHPLERSSGETIVPAGKAEKAVIQLHDVRFDYGDEVTVIKDVSLEVLPGQTVAIVGPSGGGKSTLLKLLLGYYPPTAGSVHLLGRDLASWQLEAARQQMSFVAQSTYLFPISLGENIRLGRPQASQEQVEQAARQANIHDFIASLPQGYDSPAGEWGARLSGGQKQRIALARAILKDAPILLLDEPTSALDTESETLVQQALERFSKQRTTLVVAHRLSTIKNADQVVVLQGGSIVEQGTHEALLTQGGVYLDLYQHQFAHAAHNEEQ